MIARLRRHRVAVSTAVGTLALIGTLWLFVTQYRVSLTVAVWDHRPEVVVCSMIGGTLRQRFVLKLKPEARVWAANGRVLQHVPGGWLRVRFRLSDVGRTVDGWPDIVEHHGDRVDIINASPDSQILADEVQVLDDSPPPYCWAPPWD